MNRTTPAILAVDGSLKENVERSQEARDKRATKQLLPVTGWTNNNSKGYCLNVAPPYRAKGSSEKSETSLSLKRPLEILETRRDKA